MIIYPPNYLLYRVNVNCLQNVQIPVYTLPVWEYYYKSVHQPIPAWENWEHPGNFQNKSGSSAFNWVLPFYFLKWNCYFSACKQKFLESTSRKFLRFSSARVKICQIPHVNFELTSQFLFKFCIILHCHDKTPLSYIFYSG